MSELQNIILAGLKLKGGNVTYNDWEIDPDQSFSEQELSFKHDLLQINTYEIDHCGYVGLVD